MKIVESLIEKVLLFQLLRVKSSGLGPNFGSKSLAAAIKITINGYLPSNTSRKGI